MTAMPAIGQGDPVQEHQATFRTAMMAMAEPGTILTVACSVAPPKPLAPATAALLLALADFETPVFLDDACLAFPEAGEFLRFQTGAPIVADRARAAFAVVTDAEAMATLDGFALGTLDYPDRSTTVIVQVSLMADDSGWQLSGPGIARPRAFAAGPLPDGLMEEIRLNRERFPRGLDFYFVAGNRVAALPRSTLVRA